MATPNTSGLPNPAKVKAQIDAAKKPVSKPATANQREGRTTAAPVTRKGEQGGTASTVQKVTTPKVVTSTTKKPVVNKPRTDDEISKAAEEILNAAKNIRLDFNTGGGDSGGGDSGGGNSGGNQGGQQEEIDKETRDAFALLRDTFNAYGLNDLATEIEGFMKSGLTTSEAKIELRKTKAYETRFEGNKLRAASGLNVLSEAEYLDLENSYSETLKAYGLQDYFGPAVTTQQKAIRQKAIAEVIGKDISAVEFKDRVSTAVDRVTNADAATKAAFKSLYNVTDSDLVKYFLDPTKNVQALKEKAAAAEIGGAAMTQGLLLNTSSAEELARLGVTKDEARKGYATIAEVLPTAEKLSNIYKEDQITYGQTEAEAETFKGLASAQRKRQRLAEKEIGTFSGQSGVTRASLGTTGSF